MRNEYDFSGGERGKFFRSHNVVGAIEKEIQNLAPLMPAKVILFGSYAYGEPNDNSDIDLLVIKKTVHSKIKESNEARKALKGLRMPIDTIVVSEEEFDFYKNCPNTIYAEADKKGIVLYAK